MVDVMELAVEIAVNSGDGCCGNLPCSATVDDFTGINTLQIACRQETYIAMAAMAYCSVFVEAECI
jgi:hypothetical protein